MIVFADTSALIAAYVREATSTRVQRYLLDAEVVAVSHLAWAECHACFARLQREQRLGEGDTDLLRTRLRDDWSTFIRLRVDQRLAGETTRLLRFHPLRGADAVHLASALLIHRRLAEPCGQTAVMLVADTSLAAAATAEGLEVPDLSAGETGPR